MTPARPRRFTVLAPMVPVLCLVVFAVALPAGEARAASEPPLVQEDAAVRIGDGVYVIRDQRINLVPNVGIIIGRKGVLVVDTGMGPINARTVLKEVRKLTQKKILYLTTTHFHPEHEMGAQSFPSEAAIIFSKTQKEELLEKGQDFIELFSGFSPQIARLLEDVTITPPDITYDREAEIDLGDKLVRLVQVGPAHTRGDNVIFLPQQKILFAGGLAPNRFFPILPDADADGSRWIEVLERLEQWAPRQVVPGHGEVGDASLLAAVRDYLVSLRRRVRELHGAGKSSEEIESTVSREFQARYGNWDNPEWIKNAAQNFLADLNP